MKRYIPILSIAGSDSSGGAGIQADIKTISAIGCYAETAITAITCQNTTGVSDIQGIDPAIVASQIRMVCSDIPPMAVKTGMLYSAPVIDAVVDEILRHQIPNLVVDPVMMSTSGSLLISEPAVKVMVSRLFPLASIVTPNYNEAKWLTGESDPASQAVKLRELGCRNILLKGGDNPDRSIMVDYLFLESDDEPFLLKADTVDTRNTHGTGCTLSSAIACYLALGFDMLEAVTRAKLYVTKALRAGASVAVGSGNGPVNHLFAPRHMKFIK